MAEFYGACRSCQSVRVLHTTRLYCIDCCLAEFAKDAAPPRKSETCSWCKEQVARTYQKGFCFECVLAEAANREAREVRDRAHRFIRDSLIFNAPLTLADFSRPL